LLCSNQAASQPGAYRSISPQIKDFGNLSNSSFHLHPFLSPTPQAKTSWLSAIKSCYTRLAMKIYLDTCCLNRPFDDQSQERIRLETEAMMIILARLSRKEWTWLGSQALEIEIDRAATVLKVKSKTLL